MVIPDYCLFFLKCSQILIFYALIFKVYAVEVKKGVRLFNVFVIGKNKITECPKWLSIPGGEGYQ